MTGRILAIVGTALALSTVAAPAHTVAPVPPQLAPPPQQLLAPQQSLARVYRLLDNYTGGHLYSTDLNEVRNLSARGTYHLENAGFYVLARQLPGTVPLNRFFTAAGNHPLGTNPQFGAAVGGQSEGAIGYVYPRQQPGTVPLYAWSNPITGDFLYTTNRSGELAPQSGLRYEGVVCYVYPLP